MLGLPPRALDGERLARQPAREGVVADARELARRRCALVVGKRGPRELQRGEIAQRLLVRIAGDAAARRAPAACARSA